jgi:hypothetical protein
MVGVPAHVPVDAVNVWPSVVVPVIVGRAVLTGAAAATTVVADDVLHVDPPLLVAVTSTLNVSPTNPEVIANVEPVAPLMFAQLLPVPLQLCHW